MDDAPVLRAHDVLTTVDSNARDMIARAVALQDALDMAAARASQGSSEAPLLSNLKARLAAVQGPLSGIVQGLRDGLPSVRRCSEVLQTLAARETALRQKAQIVEAAHKALDDERLKFQLEQEDFDRRRQVDEQLKQHSNSSELQHVRQQLKEAESRAARLEVSLQNKTLLTVELQEQLSVLQSERERLLQEHQRQARRAASESDRLTQQLRAAEERADQQAALLAQERKRAKATQQMLQREASRPSTQDSMRTTARALSASTSLSGTAASTRRLRDIEEIVRQNEALLLEVSNAAAENKRLRQENARLLEAAKSAQEGSHLLNAQVVTSAAGRVELQHRLDKALEETRVLQQQLRSQSEAFVRRNRAARQEDEDRKWSAVTMTPVDQPVRARMQAPVRSAPKHRGIRVQAW